MMRRLNEAFLDTAYAVALSAASDRYHATALALSEQMERDNTRIVTTSAVLMEIGNALSKLRYRPAEVALLDALEHDPSVEVVSLSDELFAHAFELYRARTDKEWGLIDCISFIVMRDRGLVAALTTDDHFRQAGFQVLLSSL